MNFLLDHDVPVVIERVLVQSDHAVKKVANVVSPVAPDKDVFLYAVQEKRIRITCNLNDFLTLAKQSDHPGLKILIRRKTRIAECAALLKLLKRAGSQGIVHNINFA